MTNLKVQIHDEINGLSCILHGDYCLPDLEIDQGPSLGKYGRMRLVYLRDHRPGLYTRLILSGKLYAHLAEIDQTSRERMKRMIPRLAKAEGIDEKLKARGPMAWVASMNSIRHRAEESILTELINE